jgi:HlyD family secretion protein/epimerase transport system membrane fusion protein
MGSITRSKAAIAYVVAWSKAAIGYVVSSVVVRPARRDKAKTKVRLEDSDLKRLTRWPRTLGYVAALTLFAGFVAWASMAPLASAALAPGVVSPDGSRKTVQHLEGGIIDRIHVREGDVVRGGQSLVTLNGTQAEALLRELTERLVHFLAIEARLGAEQSGHDEILNPMELSKFPEESVMRAVTGQQNLFESRRATMRGREQILALRIKQLEEGITGLRDRIAAEETQLSLIDREIAGVKKLYDKGLERLPRLLALQRAKAEIQGSQASNRAQIASSKQKIGETQMQLLMLQEQDREKIDEELTRVRTALAELRSQISSRQDILDRTTITAPMSGTVMNVLVTTESGVIRAGQPILEIVPDGARLIIDAHIKPNDIDNVQPGMKAQVMLTAYRQRNLPRIDGVLRSVSADRLMEKDSDQAYFLAKVEVDPEGLKELEDVRMIAGMPAEVMILNGERTFLDYLLQPILESLDKSFLED